MLCQNDRQTRPAGFVVHFVFSDANSCYAQKYFIWNYCTSDEAAGEQERVVNVDEGPARAEKGSRSEFKASETVKKVG